MAATAESPDAMLSRSSTAASSFSSQTVTPDTKILVDDKRRNSVDAVAVEEEGEEEEAVWDIFSSFYVPFLLLWLRRSMFGTANLVRSLLLGHCLQYFFANSNYDSFVENHLPEWLRPFLEEQTKAAVPPALTVLALLTVAALVVHPDGLTWYLFGRVTDAIETFWKCILSCWTILLDDHGILTSFCAVLTLLSIGAVLALLLRHAIQSPHKLRSHQPMHSVNGISPKHGTSAPQSGGKRNKNKSKKWKRRHHHHHHSLSIQPPKSIPEHEPSQDDEKFLTGAAAVAPTQTLIGRTDSNRTGTSVERQQSDHGQQQHGQMDVGRHQSQQLWQQSLNPVPAVDTAESSAGATSALSIKSAGLTVAPECIISEPPTAERSRITSVDMVADDTSCDESVRSFASAPTAVTIGSNSTTSSSVPKKKRSNNNRRKNNTKRAGKGNGTTQTTGASETTKESQMKQVHSNEQKVGNREHQTKKTTLRGNSNHYNSKPNRRQHANFTGGSGEQRTGKFTNLKQNDNYRRGGRKERTGPRTPQPPTTQSHLQHIQREAAKTTNESSFFSTPPSSPYNYPPIAASTGLSQNSQLGIQFGGDTRGKMKLAKFLEQIGLTAPQVEIILTNVVDLESLANLTPVEYQLYGIGLEKEAMIRQHLSEEKRCRLEVRPPPGMSHGLQHNQYQQQQLRPTVPSGSRVVQPCNFRMYNQFRPVAAPGATASISRSSGPFESNINSSNNRADLNLHPFEQTPLQPAPQFRQTTFPRFGGTMEQQQQQSPSSTDDAESRIEAELQELGGRMAGSILDF